jgi:hypothetical protein
VPSFRGEVATRQTESGASKEVAVSARGVNQSMEFSRTRSLGSCLQLPECSFVAFRSVMSNTTDTESRWVRSYRRKMPM